jgi:hypothetical protein
MSDKQKEIMIISMLVIIFAGLLYYNILSSEAFKKKQLARIQRHEILEAQQLEKAAARQATREFIELRILSRNQEMRDMVEFDEKYSNIKKEYLSSINKISEELEKKVINIDDISSIVQQRIHAAVVFKENLLMIEKIPEPLGGIYDLILEFLDNDIYTWQEIKSYYEGTFIGDDSDISELLRKNSELYDQIEDFQQEIYSQYDLEGIL